MCPNPIAERKLVAVELVAVAEHARMVPHVSMVLELSAEKEIVMVDQLVSPTILGKKALDWPKLLVDVVRVGRA